MAIRISHFTKAPLNKIPLAANKNPQLYGDSVVPGLKLKAIMFRKTFLHEKRIRGHGSSAATFQLDIFPKLFVKLKLSSGKTARINTQKV